ncbi:hypothetical protein QET93_010995 [Akkermansia sp. N21116]|uniref:hypothetical protein n=1 Tax=Akkermansia sp. N21116 TaxID=3040764 RepID=UPI00244E6F99|nr:hypothetical protein [Akkermansia sp. N21116]WPX40057.1 hypothetical protein QET93_010995 [Akkermansia sp. N21116]
MHIFQGFLTLLATTALLCQAELASFPDALETGKKENKNIVVVWNGSDWSKLAPKVVEEVEKKSKTTTTDAVWAVYDDKGTMTPEEQEADKKSRPPVNVWNIPSIQVYTPDKQLLFSSDGVNLKNLQNVLSNIPKAIKNGKEAEELFKKAEESKSPDEALALYDKGLSLFPRSVAKTRRDILDKIRNLDKDDTKGFRFKHESSFLGFIEKVCHLVFDEKKPEEAKKLIEQRLSIPGLTPEERQKIMAGYFVLARGDNNNKQAMLSSLQNIVKVDPKTDMGRGAMAYYNYFAKPVIMKNNRLNGKLLRPEFSPLVLNVRDKVKVAGTYRIECKVKRGGADFRNARFMSGNRVLAEITSEQKDKNRRDFMLTLADHNVPSNITLVIDTKGSGWFDLDGEIIITQLF